MMNAFTAYRGPDRGTCGGRPETKTREKPGAITGNGADAIRRREGRR